MESIRRDKQIKINQTNIKYISTIRQTSIQTEKQTTVKKSMHFLRFTKTTIKDCKRCFKPNIYYIFNNIS